MEYYHVQSRQKYANGYSTGTEVLIKEQGTNIPKNSMNSSGNDFEKDDYFSTYKEARAYFDRLLKGYYDASTSAKIVLRDEVSGDVLTYEGPQY